MKKSKKKENKKSEEFEIDLEKFSNCKCCNAEIAQLVGEPPEKYCADCADILEFKGLI